VLGLVVLGVLEPHRERAEALALGGEAQGSDERTVESTRQVAAHGDIRPKNAQRRRTLQGRAHGIHSVVDRSRELLRVARLPERAILAELARPATDGQDVSRLELGDAGEHRPRRDSGPEGEGLVDPDRIERAGDRRVAGEQGLDLAAEDDPPAVLGEVQGAHPHAIAHQREPAAPAVPQRDGELAVEARERLFAPRLVGVDDHLGVAARAEGVSQSLELRAQLEVVEDLSVEDDPERPVLVGERLLAGGKVDDREPGVGQAGALVTVDAELVGAPVMESARHRAQFRRGRPSGRGVKSDDASDPTHARRTLGCWKLPSQLTIALSTW